MDKSPLVNFHYSCTIPNPFGAWEDLGTPQTPPGRLCPLDPQALLPLLFLHSCRIPNPFGAWEDLGTPQTPPGWLRPLDPPSPTPSLVSALVVLLSWMAIETWHPPLNIQ